MAHFEGVRRAALRLEQELQIALEQVAADRRGELLCTAAEEALRAGELHEARVLLERAAATGPSRALLARIRYSSGASDQVLAETPERLGAFLAAEARAIQDDDPGLAARLFISAALSLAGELEPALAAAREAIVVARRAGGEAAGSAELAGEIIRVLDGEPARPVALESALTMLDQNAFDAPTQLHRIGVLALWTEDYGTARLVLERLVESLRGTRHYLLPTALDTLAALDFRTGRWSAARSQSAEALRLAEENGQKWQVASCLTTLGVIDACTGREADCRRRLTEARELAPSSKLLFAWTYLAAGLLELALGRPEAAVEELEQLYAGRGVGPNVVPWLTNLVEAHVRSGRLAAAGEALEALDAYARRSKSTSTAAATARCRGLVARSRFDAHFGDALDLHARLSTPFETARTQLCFGERLRRARRLAEARVQLKAALTTFEYLGAAPWSERARHELSATRPKRMPAQDGAIALLTAHELQVAALVVRGATNREAATALFVSPKTIDYHLGNIYRKLEVRSRTELTRLLSRSL